ncbi:hypothetical protein YC2023_042735 [Brassica napus]
MKTNCKMWSSGRKRLLTIISMFKTPRDINLAAAGGYGPGDIGVVIGGGCGFWSDGDLGPVGWDGAIEAAVKDMGVVVVVVVFICIGGGCGGEYTFS